MKKPCLLDQHGRPMSPLSYSFFESGNTTARREQPFYYYYAAQNTEQLLPTGSWMQLMSSSRFLFANVPIVRGGMLEQANYSFPLCAHYIGKDRKFRNRGEEMLWNWKKRNNIRGGNFNQLTNSRIRMLGYKVDGDIGTAYVVDKDGWPAVQYIRAHRIANAGDDGEGIIKKGKYKGYRLINGCIQDDQGADVAYRVTFGPGKEEYQDISALNMRLTYRADYSDQGRGIAHLVASIESFADIKRLRKYEMRAQQMFASQGFIEKNPTGSADETADAITRPANGVSGAGTATGLITQTYEEGMTRYYQSGTGSGLEAFRSDRPSADTQSWEDKIVTQALYGIEWDPNFALAIKEPGGAWARTVLQKINRTIKLNCCVEAEAQCREDIFALSMFIDMGLLEPPSDGDITSWEYLLGVPLITADSGNDQNAKREAYKLGLMNFRDIAADDYGGWWIDKRDQREVEVVDLLERNKRIQELFPELTLQECINLFEQRTPNAQAPAKPDDSAPEKPAEPAKK